MLLLGLHFALTFPALNIQATAGVADAEQGLASGLVNTSFQIGGAVVLAVTTALVTAGGTSSPQAQLAGYRHGLLVVLGVSAAGMLTTLLALRRPRRRTNWGVPDYQPAPQREDASAEV